MPPWYCGMNLSAGIASAAGTSSQHSAALPLCLCEDAHTSFSCSTL